MANRLGNSGPSTPDHDLQDQLTDLWEIIHRHMALVLTCLVITLGLGALYYLKAPRTYESQSDILIRNKHISGFRGGDEDKPVSSETIETHALRLQSPLIIEKAIAKYDLASLPSLADEEDVVKYIVENMLVSLKDENASVLNVKFRCPDPTDCRDIVAAIAKTYEDYLGEFNQKEGRDASELIRQANRLLKEQMVANEEKYREFQRNAPLMWRDGQGVNVHHERQSEIETTRQELMVERTMLEAKVASIDSAIAMGGISRDAVYFEALAELKPDTEDAMDWKSFKLAEQEHLAEREAIRQYASLLMGEYVRLMVTRSELLDEFGEGHPNLESVTQRREEVKRLLNGLLTRDTPEMTGLIDDMKVDEEKDYVEIYVQMLRDRLTSLEQQIAALDAEFQEEQKLANVMQDYLLQDQAFRSERDHTKLLFDEVVSQLKEINILQDYGGDTASILAQAKFGEQVAPHILYVGVASLFLGCLLGSVLAWSVDRSENTFRNVTEIRQALQVPVIGRIPFINKREQVASTSLPHIAPIVCTVHQDRSHVSEAFRGVRTSLYFSAAGQNLKVIQVTSPLPGDGKSTVTANLAVAIAKSGKRVLVMDADFRRPSLAKLLGKPKDCQFGLAAVIAGQADLVDSSLATDIPNLFFLPAQERPLNPSELLSTPQFKNLLDIARERFDFVLVDTPPLLAVTDPCAVAARVDGVLLTLRIRKGVQAVATRAMEMLQAVNGNVLGTIVNGIDDHGFQEIAGHFGRYGTYGAYGEDGKKSATAGESRAALKQMAARK